MNVEVTLGEVTVPVYPQRHAYLTRRIAPAIQAAVARGEGVTADSFLDFAGEGVYDLLSALMPNLEKRMPRWQFLGFGSEQAMTDNAYEPDDDTSPTLPEIREAFVVAIKANGIDELAKLGKVIDPRLIRAQVNSAIANSIDSQNSPPTNGGSPLTTSGTKAPTSTPSEDSPSDASAA